jgi:hypothetical protein
MSDVASNRRHESGPSGSVKEQVNNLLREGIRGKIPPNKLAELRRKLSNDDLVDSIQTAFYEEQEANRKRARKFASFIEKKVQHKGYPLHVVLQKAEAYRKKNNLTDVQFDEFKRAYEKLYYSRTERDQDQSIPVTNMQILFGDLDSRDSFNVKETDYAPLQDIIKLAKVSKKFHRDVILQSIGFEDQSPVVFQAKYDSNINNIAYAVHPLVVAMFAQKIVGFDHHFLFANLANIIKCKYERERLASSEDYNFLHAMLNDSHDVVCSSESVIKDLRMRANLQNNLWNTVFQMRSGKFFDVVGSDFFNAIEECKIFRYDAPDLVYSGDENVVLRRLLSAMSYNTIIQRTIPVVIGTTGVTNPVGFPIIHNSIMAKAFFVHRLPTQPSTSTFPLLHDCINQIDTYYEHGHHVPKKSEIIHIKDGIIIFHIPRRSIAAVDEYKRFINPTPTFTRIPDHILMQERLRTDTIIVDTTFELPSLGITYVLKSSVGVIVKPLDSIGSTPENIIIGNYTAIPIYPVTAPGIATEVKVYLPTLIPSESPGSNVKNVWKDQGILFLDELRTTGTIFIYELMA